MKFDTTLQSALNHDLDAGLVPMLLGDSGIGKSSFMRALGQARGTKTFCLTCNQLGDRADLTGGRLLPVKNDKGEDDGYAQFFFPHATIMECIKYANEHKRENPILFLDEINRVGDSGITSAILSLVTEYQIGNVILPSNIRFTIAGNDKGNIVSLDEASISRFSIYPVEPDLQTFLSVNPNLNPYVKKALETQPGSLFGRKIVAVSDNDKDEDKAADYYSFLDGDSFEQIATPRTITAVSAWLNTYSDKELVELIQKELLNGLLAAHTGDTLFTATLMNAIVSGVTTSANTPQAANVVKPSCYDGLVACSTRDEMENYVGGMDDREKSLALVYALHERTDRSTVIDVVANNLNALEADALRSLMTIATANDIDSENVNAFIETGTGISNQLSAILGLVA